MQPPWSLARFYHHGLGIAEGVQAALVAMAAADAALLDPAEGQTLYPGIQNAVVDTDIARLDTLGDVNTPG